MATKAKAGGKGQRKYNRSKKKAAGRGNPISLFVRGKISGEEYFKLTNQARKV
jgi:hypothetical protein